MYNLQTAKEEIEQVAKHTTALTEYVMSLSERVQSHENIETKLADFKKSLLEEIDAKFAELERKIFGSETSHEGKSAISELGHKIAGLMHVAAPDHASDDHHPDPPHSDHHG